MAPITPAVGYLILFIVGAIPVIGFRYVSQAHTWRLWRALRARVAELGFSPTHLTSVDVAFIFAVAASKSGLSRLGLLPALCPLPNGQGFALPEIRLAAPLSVSSTDRENYQRALAELRYINDEADPSSHQIGDFSLLLASVTTPLMLLTIAHYASPIVPFGVVNTRNRFEFLLPERCTKCEGALSANVKFGGPKQLGRRTKRGVEFDVIIEVYEHNSSANKHTEAPNIARSLIFRQVITVMQTLPRTTKPHYREKAPVRNQSVDPSAGNVVLTECIHIPYRAPSAWARVCRDYNPIHLSAVAGRVLGLPGRIAHGNHVAAAALESISRTGNPPATEPFAMEVTFRKPVVLPIDIDLTVTNMGHETVQFMVGQQGRPSVEGAVEMLRIEQTG